MQKVKLNNSDFHLGACFSSVVNIIVLSPVLLLEQAPGFGMGIPPSYFAHSAWGTSPSGLKSKASNCDYSGHSGC